jgi:hypothetical protein
MIIYAKKKDESEVGGQDSKSVRIEDTKIEPVHPGIVLFKYILPKIDLSLHDFSLRTSIPKDRAEQIADGRALMNVAEIKQLKQVFPKAWRLFRDIQRDFVYFRENKSWRPLGAPRKTKKSSPTLR